MAAVISIRIDGQNDAQGAFDNAERGLKSLGRAADDGGRGFGAFGEMAIGALRRVGEMAIEAGAQAAQAIGQFAIDSVKAAGDFEAGVNNLAAVTGAALEDAGFSMDDVREKALQLGADTAYSAAEALDAMTELAKGGVPIQDVMNGATDATLALAAAADLELGPAAEIVSKQLGVWGETGVTAAEVSDLLASAANASTVDVEELALGLANAGGTAKTAGASFKDLTQTMALIAPNFSSASDAGTSLKTFLSRLIPTTDSAKAAMAALGLYTDEAGSAFFDAQGQFVGMEEAARLLQGATAGLSEEEKLLAFNTIFGSDAIRAAAAIANAGADGFNAMGVSMDAAGGAAAAAAIKNQGFNFAMEQMQGSIETLQIVIGSALLPVLSQLVGQVTEGINVVMGFTQTILGAPDPLAALTAQFPILGDALTVAQGLFQQLTDFIITIMPTVQSIVATTIQLIAAIWQQYGDEILQITQAIWTAVQGAIQIILGVIQGLLAFFLAGVTNDWTTGHEQLAAANTTIWEGIATFFSGILEIIAAGFGTSLDEIANTWASNFRKMGDLVGPLMQQAQAAIESAMAAIRSAFNSIAGAIDSAISKINAFIAAVNRASGLRLPSIGGGGSSTSGRASGGDVVGGKAYLVGEQGPELFYSKGGGRIANAPQTQAITSSTTNQYYYSPTYSNTPARPSEDFATMKLLATAGGS